MTKEQAIEALKEHKRQIDKKYINTRNSKAIETVLSMLEEQEKIIDLIAERLRYESSMQQEFCIDICDKKKCNIDKCKERIKQYFENKAKEVEE